MAAGPHAVSRMRAIVCTPRLPWPLDDGGRVGLWQITWSFARHADTLLLSMTTPGAVVHVPPEITTFGVDVRTVPHAPPSMPLALWRSLTGPWPYTLERYRDTGYDAALRGAVAEWQPDVVVLNHLHLASYAPACAPAAVVLREHNVETIWLERYAATLANPLARAFAIRESRRMRTVEARLCAEADLVLAVQPEEEQTLRSMAPGAVVETIPIGVDFERFRPRRPETPPVVLLAAAFGWAPNVAGARRFLAEGWPMLRTAAPGARLRLVGKDLPADLADQARASGAEPVGYVDDMTAEFAAASLLVVPLWVGAGARVKIVEALAARLPVVATPVGIEGLGLTAGRDVLVAADAPGLARHAASLLSDRTRADAQAEQGHARAAATWSLDAVAVRTIELATGAIARTRRARVP